MSTFITRLESRGGGPRLAVKDIIDVAGVPTTAGCRALERRAGPAASDAACLAGARAAGAQIVGKTNLHELAMLPLGTNPWFGTPVNPLDPALIPGGSSSGSAVAVANGEADVSLGSDTGGSIRIPAACCGIAGLKTTYGRVPLDGVWPLAPSLDTVGPMAADVGGLATGMQLLEPGFRPAAAPAVRVGRVRTSSHPDIEAAVDAALAAAEVEVVPVDLDLDTGANCFATIYFSEMWEVDHALVEADPEGVGEDIASAVGVAAGFRALLEGARAELDVWRKAVLDLFADVEVLALPAIPVFPPRLDEIGPDPSLLIIEITRFSSPFNAAGLPATAQPVPVPGGRLPASLQMVGSPYGEELLVTTALAVEKAVG